jgi:DNA-binding GntR family transcriptional regulator
MTGGLTYSRPVERRLLRDEVRDRLTDEILSGRLAPGSRIHELRLAAQFGVSQAPVREALRDLEVFGFVVSAPYHGARVRQFSLNDLVEIYPIRAALESAAARAAATRIDDGALDRLAQLIDEMRAAAERGDQHAHASADFAFHQTVIQASGNRVLERIWQTLRLAMTTGITHSMSGMTHRSLKEIGERHLPVLDALRGRDPSQAEAMMRAHIEEPGQWILDAAREEHGGGTLADRHSHAIRRRPGVA